MSAEPIPHFLVRLNLGMDADARDIKRAYARELKLIDQEADLPAFQALRECYEIALRWAAYEADRKEQEALSLIEAPPCARQDDGLDALDIALPAPAGISLAKSPSTARPAEATPAVDSDQLSLTVFERFQASYTTLSQGRSLDDTGLWETELRRRLEDEEMVNLEARTIFEARVAHLLASQWQLANAPLLDAAAKVFAWSGDRRRLQQFGYAGGFVYQALEERTLFDAQNPADIDSQRRLMARLRSGVKPEPAKLRTELAQVERMIARFPTWLAVHANPEVVEQWRSALPRRHAHAPAPEPAMADNAPEPVLEGDTSRRGFDKAWILFAILGIFTLFRMWNGQGYNNGAPSRSATRSRAACRTASAAARARATTSRPRSSRTSVLRMREDRSTRSWSMQSARISNTSMRSTRHPASGW